MVDPSILEGEPQTEKRIMRNLLLKASLIPVLAMALWAGACSDQASPEQLLGPEQAAFARGGKDKDSADAEKKVKREKKGRKVKGKGRDGRYAEYQVATGRLPEDTLFSKKVIGPRGGTLKAAGHEIIVPAGAVNGETLFSIKQFRKVVDSDGTVEIAVALRAVQTSRDGSEKDVGSGGFLQPVTLAMSYAWADDIDDFNAADATIIWLRDDDNAEEVDAAVEVDRRRKQIVTTRNHFSDYAIAWPD